MTYLPKHETTEIPSPTVAKNSDAEVGRTPERRETGETRQPAERPRRAAHLRIVADQDMDQPPWYGKQAMTIWVEQGVDRPGLAAAMVQLSETGESWDALGWSLDDIQILTTESSHDEALAHAVRHAREVANGTERKRAEDRSREKAWRHQTWTRLRRDARPPAGPPATNGDG